MVDLDVSKATVAVCYELDHQVKHLEVSNDAVGCAHLLKACGSKCLFVLEATGAYYLHKQGGHVAVINPLVIKRFIQMHLGKGKTDRQDAQWLLRYSQQQPIKRWQPQQALLVECRQLE